MRNSESFYKERIEKYSAQSGKLTKQLGLISFFRLLSFVIALVSLIFLIKISPGAGICGSLFFLVCFFTLVKRYHILSRKNAHTKNLLQVNSEELSSLKHIYSQFDGGAEFINPAHPFTPDLDIFGAGSVFQYLNRTTTLRGKQMLADWLSYPCRDIPLILRTQVAVRELATMTDNRQNFRATGKMNQETISEMQDILEWLQEKNRYFGNSFFHILCYALPVLTLLLLTATIVHNAFSAYLIYLFILQLLFIAMYLRHNNKVHGKMGKKLELFRKYGKLLRYIEQENYQSELVSGIQHQLKSDDKGARDEIIRLSSIVSAFDNRLNLLAGVVLNGLLLWDIQCVLRLEKWKEKNKDNVVRWFNALGEYDALCSLSNFAFNHPEYIFPEPDTGIILDFKQTGHPLIPSGSRINNDIQLSCPGEFVIITGANMAGKSTFLRTVSVNFILGMAGAPVCAREARFSPVEIFSSMRTSDSLQKNESYFYAELKRLGELFEQLETGKKLFIVLDEILKGTNSADKQKGSRAVLEKIIKLNGAGLIATHDLDLAGLEKKYPDNLKNKCFEIELDGDKIQFDYKLYVKSKMYQYNSNV